LPISSRQFRFLAPLAFFPAFFLLLAAMAWSQGARADTLRIGSKRFTESYIVGEILTQVAAPHASVQYLPGLGNTAIVFEALKAGNIDLYPD